MSTTPKKPRDLAGLVRTTGKKLGKTLRTTARAAGKAAGKTAEVVAVRAKVSAKQVREKSSLLKLGQSLYQAHKSGLGAEQIVASLQPQLGKLDGLQQEIAALKLREKKIRSAK